MDTARAMNYKELHLHILRILYQLDEAISPKELIARFAANYVFAYTPEYIEGEAYKITNAKIYSAIKFLEKEQLIEREESSSGLSPRTPPSYRLSKQGKDLIKQSTSLNFQNLLSFFVASFLRENAQKFHQLGLTDEACLGIIGPRAPLGQTVLGSFDLQNKQDPLGNSNKRTKPIYFLDFDHLLLESRSSKPENTTSHNDEATQVYTNIVFRSCYLVEDGTLRMDLGNDQLDFIIALMLISNFPHNYEKTIKEVYRVLKPGGVAIFQELDLENSVILWTLQRFTKNEIEVLPNLFYNLFRQDIKDVILINKELTSKIENTFGELIGTDEFKEVQLIYARKTQK